MNNKVVYGWFDGEECFYIGIGTVERSQRVQGRNQFCRRKRAKAENRDTFNIQIFESELTLKEAKKREQYYVQQFGRRDLGLGTLTNLTDGGDGIQNPSPSTRKLLSKKSKGKNNGFYGKTHTPQVIKKISETHKGKTISEKTKSLWREQRKGENNGMYGRTHTSEAKNKISKANSKKVITPEGEFESITKAAQYYGTYITKISRLIKQEDSGFYLKPPN